MSKRYLCDAFELSTINHLRSNPEFLTVVEISGETLESAKRWLEKGPWASRVRNANTASLLSGMLEVKIEASIRPIVLKWGDEIMVAERVGDEILWFLVDHAD